MDAHPFPLPAAPHASARGAHHRRHVVALIIAAAIAGLVFAAYRQPDFILDFAGIRLC